MTKRIGLSDLRRASDARAAALSGRFADALRVGDGAAAERIVDDALGAGIAPEAVQSLVITPAMVRIGELWEARAIEVADEHLATSISHRALIRLFEAISAGATRARSRSRERVLLAAVEGQQHVLGLRMVADVLEGAGFDVLYLGADVPVASLQTFLARHRPAVVGLAFGIALDVACLADALWLIHETSPDTRVLLGGRAVPPGLQAAGYPVIADTLGVVDAINALLAGPRQPLPAVVDRLRSDGARRRSQEWPQRVGETDAVAEALARSAEQAVDIAREHVRRADGYRRAAQPDRVTEPAVRRAAYVSMSRLEIPAERAPELVAAFRDRSRLVEEADGFVDLEVWQSDRDPGEILMVSRWRDRATFTQYMKSAEHKTSHDRIDPDLKRDIKLRRLDHLHTYEVVSE